MTNSHAHGDSSRLSVNTCVTVYVALMVLLVITYALDHVHMGGWNLILSMIIAVIKAAMVIWFFMEAKWSNRLVLLAFGSGLLMMFVCALLMMADYMTRV